LEKIQEVCELLKQENYTYQEIANITGMSYTYVANINLGKLSYCNELPYNFPIQNKHNGRRNPLNKQEALEIIQLLKENQLTQKEIGTIYGCSYKSISRINNGNLYRQDNENYPIRKGYPRKTK
jgi:DNA-directed RNA polymerase specialized sigma subunit